MSYPHPLTLSSYPSGPSFPSDPTNPAPFAFTFRPPTGDAGWAFSRCHAEDDLSRSPYPAQSGGSGRAASATAPDTENSLLDLPSEFHAPQNPSLFFDGGGEPYFAQDANTTGTYTPTQVTETVTSCFGAAGADRPLVHPGLLQPLNASPVLPLHSYDSFMLRAMGTFPTPRLDLFVDAPTAVNEESDWLEQALLEDADSDASSPTDTFEGYAQSTDLTPPEESFSDLHYDDSFTCSRLSEAERVAQHPVMPHGSIHAASGYASMPPPAGEAYASYGPHFSMSPSFMRRPLLHMPPHSWAGWQQHSEPSSAGSSRVQSPQLCDAMIYPYSVDSAATTPSASYLSWPPSPSIAPASGPMRNQRRRRDPTTTRRTRPPRPRHFCPSVGNVSEAEITEMVKTAKEIQAQEVGSVQCTWNGCTASVVLGTLRDHLCNVHGIRSNAALVKCMWDGECKDTIIGTSVRKHVVSGKHLDLPLRCTGCGYDYQRSDVLKKHLRRGRNGE
ncbi:hypothetical protein B0H19DRAFT_1259096 [Mycena capillaripes]|nr:hypothetical protein B0H19DRAFT_1259096 [Mycena capillaripes]